MRVLHVAQPTTAGVARVVAALTRDQVARGWDVTVACPPDGELAEAVRAAGARHAPWRARRSPGPSVVAETAALSRVVRAARPELVHLHSSKAGLVGRLLLRGRIPTVLQPHAWSFLASGDGPLGATTRGWERASARWAHAVAVVSEDERAAGERVGVRGRWEVLPNGVDMVRRPAPADRDAARATLGLPEGPLAVCAGRLCRQKGQDALLAAWPAVTAAVPGAGLVLVGDGPDRGALAAAAPADVRFVGDVRDPDPWLAAADVVVLPSRWEAGLSLVAMEAMALGRSVVSARVAGVDRCLAGAGAVVDLATDGALAAAVAERLCDREAADGEGRHGRRHVEQEHDLRATDERVARLYLRLLGR